MVAYSIISVVNYCTLATILLKINGKIIIPLFHFHQWILFVVVCKQRYNWH